MAATHSNGFLIRATEALKNARKELDLATKDEVMKTELVTSAKEAERQARIDMNIVSEDEYEASASLIKAERAFDAADLAKAKACVHLEEVKRSVSRISDVSRRDALLKEAVTAYDMACDTCVSAEKVQEVLEDEHQEKLADEAKAQYTILKMQKKLATANENLITAQELVRLCKEKVSSAEDVYQEKLNINLTAKESVSTHLSNIMLKLDAMADTSIALFTPDKPVIISTAKENLEHEHKNACEHIDNAETTDDVNTMVHTFMKASDSILETTVHECRDYIRMCMMDMVREQILSTKIA